MKAVLAMILSAWVTSGAAAAEEVRPSPIEFSDHRSCIAALNKGYDDLGQMKGQWVLTGASINRMGGNIPSAVREATTSSITASKAAMEAHIKALTGICQLLAP